MKRGKKKKKKREKRNRDRRKKEREGDEKVVKKERGRVGNVWMQAIHISDCTDETDTLEKRVLFKMLRECRQMTG